MTTSVKPAVTNTPPINPMTQPVPLTTQEQTQLKGATLTLWQTYQCLKAVMDVGTLISGEQPVLTYPRLAARLMTRFSPAGCDSRTAFLITPDQVRYRLRKLERWGLIQRLPPSGHRRLRFYHPLACDHHPLPLPGIHRETEQERRKSFAGNSDPTPPNHDENALLPAVLAVIRDRGVSSESVCAVFNRWRDVHNHPRAKLDPSRARCIARALAQGYSVTDCYQAIAGCRHSPFHQGDNPQGQRYDSVSLIFRDADHIERFMAMEAHPPTERQAAYREAHASGLDWLADAFEAQYGDRLPTGNPFLWKRQKT